VDAVHNAFHKLALLKQGSKTADEHIADFKIVIAQTKMTDEVAIINLFQQTLNRGLLSRILQLDTVPTTLADWYKKATQLDNAWRQMKTILGHMPNRAPIQNQNRPKQSNKPTNRFVARFSGGNGHKAQHHDPHAMDVDAMTVDEHAEHMQKGLCFNCHEADHISRFCPKKRKYTPSTSSFVPKKPSYQKNAKDAMTRIQAIIDELPEEEKEKFDSEFQDF
jgi:hypothetical protein